MTPRTVTIPHLGRVEGHGGIHVTLEGQQVADVNLDIHEGSRYYETLLVGKHFRDVQGIKKAEHFIGRDAAVLESHDQAGRQGDGGQGVAAGHACFYHGRGRRRDRDREGRARFPA